MTVTHCPAAEAVHTLKDSVGKMLELEGSHQGVFLHISDPAPCTLCMEIHPVMFVESVKGSDMKGAVSA